MALFTGKGDDGTTYFFGSSKRCNKDHPLTEALGTLDEINSYIGLCKAQCKDKGFRIEELGKDVVDVLEEVQQNLFIAQAELAGADKTIIKEKVEAMSETINDIEKLLPKITTFFVAGGSKLSAHFDVARTIARRAERRVIALSEEHLPHSDTLAYLNRLSSLLYALARLAAHKSGNKEATPHY